MMAIRNLNDLKRGSHCGLYKRGLATSLQRYNLICDYLEKINYSIQDIEKCLLREPDNTVLISVMVFVTWIQEAVDELNKSYHSYALDGFEYNKEILSEDKKYLKAIRSFVFAHPLTTNKHKEFGFDGSLRCVDIRPSGSPIMALCDKSDLFFIDTNGLVAFDKQRIDYWLHVYDEKKYNNEFTRYIGVSLNTFCDIANDYVDYLYAMDKHLFKMKTRRGITQEGYNE